MKSILFIIAIACSGENTVSEIVLDNESYVWACSDRQTQSEIEMTAQYCSNTTATLKAELTFNDGQVKEFNLPETYDCLWEEEFIMIEEVCIQIIDVTVVVITDD